ncbi:MAG: ATP-binding cassette domain-containing protein [FCB group bacterium]|nr:ATP-binding cassette domain-containing protein [FCB group bacterium]
MIRFDQVSYAYPPADTQPVLRDISLTFKSGEEAVIMGGNGSGKTTLGLLLCGILKPQAGKITIDGRRPGASEDEMDNGPIIGFLFQDPDNGLVATTVEREVAFSLENRNQPTEKIKSVVNRTLDLFGISDFRDRLVWHLSGGEKQRLSLAGLFASGPNILFLDEPVSYLDFAGTGQLEKALRTVKETDPNITIIRVTQFPTLAENHDRAIIIGDGQILADDSPHKIFPNREIMNRAGLRPPLSYLTPRPIQLHSMPPANNEIKPEPVLKVEHLSFNYNFSNSAQLIDDISLNINQGEVIAVVGSSGSGKSTLAQLICGIYKPTSGSISLGDARAVMSFQQPEKQFFLDTAFDEIAFGVRQDYDDDEALSATVRRSMETAGLDFDTFRDRDPHSLSGGEARRLAFAVVTALKAELIIFDEPTCALDEPGLISFKKLVARSIGAGKSVMIITHNSDIIGDLADRVVLLKDGKIGCSADPITFFENDQYKAILPMPGVIRYQINQSGRVVTSSAEAFFDLDEL